MTPLERISAITERDLALLGMQDIAYIRRVEDEAEGPRYMVHAADGTPIAVMENRDVAFAAVRQNGMAPVSVH